jgi:hypothetical protein
MGTPVGTPKTGCQCIDTDCCGQEFRGKQLIYKGIIRPLGFEEVR